MRKLTLDICDYNKHSVCQLYDSRSDILGQATEVYIQTEPRSGWKELSFTLPTSYETEYGVEKNHRLEHLIASWLIKAEDDYETDWYVISEPTIRHNAFSQNVEVLAGHISQTLKNKNLGLEFSDEEGNNIGTALDLLETILDGTGWTPGNVARFMEDYDYTTEKQRSLNAAAKTGAFKLIADMCDLFEARPVFHGDSKQVDILPLNPFSREIWYEDDIMYVGRPVVLEPNQIPEAAKTANILELHYDKNITGLTRTINIENLVTKLNVQNDSSSLEPFSLSEAYHYEYTYDGLIHQGEEKYFEDDYGDRYYFTALNDIQHFVYSTMDYLSQSYIWDGQVAHPVYRHPKSDNFSKVEVEQTSVQNWFSYLMNFNYYSDIGLFSQEMLNAAAEYQRTMPAYLEESYNKSNELTEDKGQLSAIGESSNGFLKLKISGAAEGERSCLKLYIDTAAGEEGVIYRSDYKETRKKYFSWYVAHELKENGDSVNNVGSMIYIIQDRGENQRPLWIRGYLRSIDDVMTEYKDIDGNVTTRYANFVYTDNNQGPSFVTTFIDWDTFTDTFENLDFSSENTHVFLFCTNSIIGKLGEKFMLEESVIESLKSQTKDVTEVHPTFFADYDVRRLPSSPSSKTTSYAFGYVTKKEGFGDLYFYCYGVYNDDVWSRVYVSSTEPNVVAHSYYYNPRQAKLYYSLSGAWVYMDSVEEQRMTKNLGKALYFCLRRDMAYKGLYEKYVYSMPQTYQGELKSILPIGNYAIETPYYFYWLFTTTITMDATVMGHESYDLHTISYTYDGEYYTSGNLPITAKAWYEYDIKKELDILTYNQNGELIAKLSTCGQSVFRPEITSAYIVISTKEIPEEGSITAKNSYSIWVDTTRDVLYQENSVANVVEAQVKRYDTIEYPSENLLADTKFVKGDIDDNGADETSKECQRSYNIDLYSNVVYEFNFPADYSTKVYVYDVNKRLINIIFTYNTLIYIQDKTDDSNTIIVPMPTDTQGNRLFKYTFRTKLNTGYAKITYKQETAMDTTTYYLRVQDYANKLFAEGKEYTILHDVHTEGAQNGIDRLVRLYANTADKVYLESLPALEAAQKEVKDREVALSTLLGDMYREGWWQTSDYVKEDIKRLYADSMSNLKEISQPDITYELNFLDTYSSNNDDEFYVDEHTGQFDYNDILASDVVHLIDPSINVNIWAYLELLKKCYSAAWKTTLEINTSLSDASQHSFTDVMSYIADVAKKTKSRQSVYERAENISPDGTITTGQITGDISTNNNKIDGANSNWYTDENGDIIIESPDGLSAMKITGTGFFIASSKNEYGDWIWRSMGNGEGITGDSITGGTISGTLIRAGTLMASSVVSDFGQDLDIASNKALFLYATVDGARPAGSLETVHPRETDSYIIIQAQDGDNKAFIDVASGGKVNVYGGSGINLSSGGDINVNSDSSIFVNSGGKVRVNTGSSFRIHADTGYSVDSPLFKITETAKSAPSKITYRDWYTKYGDNYDDWPLSVKEDYLDLLSADKKNVSLTITGDINAQTGTIGGMTINGGIYYNISDLSTAFANKGIYLSTDGFRLRASYVENSQTKYYDALKFTTNGQLAIDFTHVNTSGISLLASQVAVGNLKLDTKLSNMDGEIAAKPVVTVAASAPSNKKAGDIWFDTSNNRQKTYDGSKWTTETIPTLNGALMDINANSGTMYLYTSNTKATNAIAMDKNGISIDSSAAVNIKATSGDAIVMNKNGVTISSDASINIKDGNTNAISMSKSGMSLSSSAGVSIASTGFLSIASADDIFKIQIGVSGKDNTLKFAGFEATGTGFASTNGKVAMISTNNGASFNVKKNGSTSYSDIVLNTSGVGVCYKNGEYKFYIDINTGDVNTRNLTAYGDLTVTGAAKVTGTATVTGAVTVNSTATVTGVLNANGGISINGANVASKVQLLNRVGNPFKSGSVQVSNLSKYAVALFHMSDGQCFLVTGIYNYGAINFGSVYAKDSDTGLGTRGGSYYFSNDTLTINSTYRGYRGTGDGSNYDNTVSYGLDIVYGLIPA